MDDEHGHHPSHTFEPQGSPEHLPELEALCAPGRNVRHDAICDGCDEVSHNLAGIIGFSD